MLSQGHGLKANRSRFSGIRMIKWDETGWHSVPKRTRVNVNRNEEVNGFVNVGVCFWVRLFRTSYLKLISFTLRHERYLSSPSPLSLLLYPKPSGTYYKWKIDFYDLNPAADFHVGSNPKEEGSERGVERRQEENKHSLQAVCLSGENWKPRCLMMNSRSGRDFIYNRRLEHTHKLKETSVSANSAKMIKIIIIIWPISTEGRGTAAVVAEAPDSKIFSWELPKWNSSPQPQSRGGRMGSIREAFWEAALDTHLFRLLFVR